MPTAKTLPNGPDAQPTPVAQADRRNHPRYAPDAYVPVFFAHPEAETPTAGLFADVSNGGARIIAPPTARPMLHWSDPLAIVISYSDATRESGIEGLQLDGHVVRIAVDETGYVVHVRFDKSNGDWSRLEQWIDQLATQGR